MTRPKKILHELLRGIDVRKIEGDLDVPVSGIQYDSRKIEPGEVFVAMPGLQSDGHQYLQQAAKRGAVAALVSRRVPMGSFEAVVQVGETREALSLLSANFWDHPSLDMSLVGITGTNGKTTLTYLLEHIIAIAGEVPGVVGTTGARFAGQCEDMVHTTPEAPDLQRLLGRMREAGVSTVAMEVSSHALDLNRARGCHFRVGVFTNLSRDHLDYHGDLQRYAEAKSLLFSRELKESQAGRKSAVVNRDDPVWREMVRGWEGEVLTFGFQPDADIHPVGEMHSNLEGFRSRVAYPHGQVEVTGHLTGKHNLQNALAAFAVGKALGYDAEGIARGIAACRIVPGRLQRIVAQDGPAVFVDYAHTDQALFNVVNALRPLTAGRLIVVFGCGGDRDRGKRPLMGKAVAQGADLAVVTSDNPRTESPFAIIEQILPGLDGAGFTRIDTSTFGKGGQGGYAVVPDRREAIGLAVASATPEDVVLIAGKGHENYQIIGTMRTHFDDCEEARGALQAWTRGDIP